MGPKIPQINVATIIPSNLSINPPCPGIIFELSFTLHFRFIKLSNRSPTWEQKESKMANKNSVCKLYENSAKKLNSIKK